MIKKKPTTKLLKKAPVKKFTHFRTMVRSRHPSHSPLRKMLSLLPFRSVVRLGSVTSLKDDTTRGGRRLECNTVQAIKNSADKRLMKMRFSESQVKTASWMRLAAYDENHAGLEFPIIIKHSRSSRGEGIYLIKTGEQYTAWKHGKTLENYIVEKYHDYSREYRLHVTEDGCFYACRKMLKEGTPENKRWFRNDSNCVWVIEENPQFDKPVNWNTITAECVKALKAVGLDIGACDVKVQSAIDGRERRRENPEFIILEINSAPSFGDKTLQHYLIQIPRILKKKFVNQNN